MDRFFWVDIKYACFGLGSLDGVVTVTPPIVAWMKGKTLIEVRPWLLKKGAKVLELNPSQLK